MIDEAAWDQTVEVALNTKNAEGTTVITKEPDAEAYTNEIVDAALAELGDVDTTGCRLHAPRGDPQRGRRLGDLGADRWCRWLRDGSSRGQQHEQEHRGGDLADERDRRLR